MQRQSAEFPEIPQGRPPLRRSSPSSQGIGEPGRSRTVDSPKNRRACAPFLGPYLERCSASDSEPPLLPLALRPPCGTTSPSQEEGFLEGFVVPGRGRL